jgi:hypothetical protein
MSFQPHLHHGHPALTGQGLQLLLVGLLVLAVVVAVVTGVVTAQPADLGPHPLPSPAPAGG